MRSMQAFSPFVGGSTYYLAYICFDMRAVTSYSYYYYQQSDKETGFSNERIVGLTNGTAVTSTSQVCKTTVDVSEYHTLVKSGAGYSSLVTCPDVMLGNYNYKYTDSTGSYCTNTTVMDVCSNKSVIIFNYTTCSQRIAYSASGIIGCIISISSGSTTYVTTYNFDTNVDGSTTYRLTCWAMAYNGSNVIASIKPTDCDNQQSPTTLPTGGAIVTMTPYCVPTTTSSTSKTDIGLIVGLVLGFLILIIIIILIIYFCCCWWPPRRRNKLIRAKKRLEVEEHPMAEKSLELDAPVSLDPVPESGAKPNKAKGKTGQTGIPDPMRETSMMLNLKERTWILGEKQMANGKHVPNGIANGGPIRRGGLTVADLETGSVMGPSLEEAVLSSRSNHEFKASAKGSKTGDDMTRSITSIEFTTSSKSNPKKAPGSKFARGRTSIGPMTVIEGDERSMTEFVAAESGTTSKAKKKSPQLKRGKTVTTLSKAKSIYASQSKGGWKEDREESPDSGLEKDNSSTTDETIRITSPKKKSKKNAPTVRHKFFQSNKPFESVKHDPVGERLHKEHTRSSVIKMNSTFAAPHFSTTTPWH
ncbi:hypothetical protein ACJMK2_039737 [Sinanodonta woodiana]|uniref:DUF7042 domain-containing protein n=1 Tax=Sinanodonta woodiana TaxID=1069815 RepID=A0ABD3WCX4_SINWO